VTETKEERTRRLIGVARDIIAEEGIAACTFRRLAAVAGSSTRPFTHAFGTRERLLRAVALATWEDSVVDVHRVEGGLERPADWRCVDELVAIGEQFLPLDPARAKSERVYIEILMYGLAHPPLHRELLGFSEAANAQLAGLVAEAQRRGQVRSDRAPLDLVMAFWSFHEGLAITSLYEPGPLPPALVMELWRDGVARLFAP
jgi:AcrR family transcriptional regulator